MSIRVPFSFIKRIGGTTGSLYFARAVDRKILLAANFDYEAISVHGSTNSDALREEQARIALKYPMPLVPLTGKELVRRCRSIAADGLSEMKQCRLSGYIYPDQIGKFRRALAKAEGKPLPPMEI